MFPLFFEQCIYIHSSPFISVCDTWRCYNKQYQCPYPGSSYSVKSVRTKISVSCTQISRRSTFIITFCRLIYDSSCPLCDLKTSGVSIFVVFKIIALDELTTVAFPTGLILKGLTKEFNFMDTWLLLAIPLGICSSTFENVYHLADTLTQSIYSLCIHFKIARWDNHISVIVSTFFLKKVAIRKAIASVVEILTWTLRSQS